MLVSNEQLWKEQEEADWIDSQAVRHAREGLNQPNGDSESSISFRFVPLMAVALFPIAQCCLKVELTLSREALQLQTLKELVNCRFPLPGWVIHGNGSVSRAGSSFRQRGDDVVWKAWDGCWLHQQPWTCVCSCPVAYLSEEMAWSLWGYQGSPLIVIFLWPGKHEAAICLSTKSVPIVSDLL